MRSSLALLCLWLPAAAHAGAEARIIELVAEAEVLWRDSCPVPPVEEGICARVVTDDASRACAAGQRLVPVARHRKRAAAAQRKLARAVGRLRRQPSERWSAGLRTAAARARLLQGDARFERLIALRLSLRRLRGVRDLERLIQRYAIRFGPRYARARDHYHDVIRLRHAAAAIVAMARLGQLLHHGHRVLTQARIPAMPRAPDRRQFFCDTLSDWAGSYQDNAWEAFETCADRVAEFVREDATAKAAADHWGARCRRYFGMRPPH
jgi:hypothetical protein